MIDAAYAVLIALLALWGVRRRAGCVQNNLLSVQDTGDLKGLFCIGILLHHFSSFLTQSGPVVYVFSHVGKTIVGGFFFLSAYGLVKGSGGKTLRYDFLPKRYSKLLIPFWLCLALYVLQTALDPDQSLRVSVVLRSLLPLRSMVFGSWYIGAAALLYLLFYLSVKFCKKTDPALPVVLFLAGFTVFYDEWSPFFFAFPLGMIAARYEEKVLCVFRKLFWPAVVGFPALVFGAGLLKLYGQKAAARLLVFAADLVMCLAFPLFVYVLLIRVQIGNRMLHFLGKYSYEIYMLHYAAMRTVYIIRPALHPVLFLACSIGLTVLTAVPVHWLAQKLIGLLPWMKKKAPDAG